MALVIKNQSPITVGLNGNRWDVALTGCYTLAEREKNEKILIGALNQFRNFTEQQKEEKTTYNPLLYTRKKGRMGLVGGHLSSHIW